MLTINHGSFHQHLLNEVVRKTDELTFPLQRTSKQPSSITARLSTVNTGCMGAGFTML